TVVNIDAGTANGNGNMTLTTGTEVETFANAFTVAAGTPVLQTVNPGSGQQGQQSLSVNLTGQFTHFVQGTTTASFGAGITVVSLTVDRKSVVKGMVNIDGGTGTGNQNRPLTAGLQWCIL